MERWASLGDHLRNQRLDPRRRSAPTLNLLDVSQDLSGLLTTLLVGRILLSILPAGVPGRHSTKDLAETWAASLLLGILALTVQEQSMPLIGVVPHRWVLLLPWCIVAVLRLLTLPGAMPPKHEVRHEAPCGLASVLLILPWAAVAMIVWLPNTGRGLLATWKWMPLISLGALLVLVSCGLRGLRRAPVGRRLIVGFLAFTPLISGHLIFLSLSPGQDLAMSGATVYSILWIRRAERRARTIAALSFAGLAHVDPYFAPIALVGLAALLGATAPQGRADTLRSTWWAFAIAGAALYRADILWIGPSFSMVRSPIWFTAPWIVWLCFALLGGLMLIRRPSASAGEPLLPRRELVFLGALILVGALVAECVQVNGVLLTVALLPAVALWCGACLVQPERVGRPQLPDGERA